MTAQSGPSRRPRVTGERNGARTRIAQPPVETIAALCGLAFGLVAWAVYADAGLVLSHYDAKAHLVVARRVIDSITPGWKQIGAVWLPLPHLLNLLPTQIDVLYRTGAFASALSVACLAGTTWMAARFVRIVTGSATGAAAAAALLLLNPNLLFLHVTPMTEPLLLVLTFSVTVWLYEAVEANLERVPPKLALALFAATWTRYEAWLVVPAALAAATYALWRRGVSGSDLAARTLRLAVWPAAGVLLFLLNSRATVGAWFVSGGFFERDALYAGQPLLDLLAVWWGTHRLSGYGSEIAGLAAAAVLCAGALRDRQRASRLVPIALAAAALLPAYAFHEGHPFRIRYMIPSVAACALFAGMGIGLIDRASRRAGDATASLSRSASPFRRPRLAVAAAALLVAAAVVESPPFGGARILDEFTWDAAAGTGRGDVTRCLSAGPRGKVLASMGSLAHFMQELSHEGFDIADFIHEGNGAIWTLAMSTGPAPHAAWMLTEEASEGGDVIARRIRDDPEFVRGMTRICEGGGVALYRRDDPALARKAQNLTPSVP